MNKITTFTALQKILSTFLNTLQDRALGIAPATKNNDLSAALQDVYGILWSYPTGIASAAAPVLIDDGIDWRDRFVLGVYGPGAAAAELPGGANDYLFNQRVRGHAVAGFFAGWFSTGGYSAVGGGGTAVSAGNPPIDAVGGVRSTYQQLEKGGADVRLYVDPAANTLKIYNNSGGTIYPFLLLLATGDSGKR